MVGQNGDPVAIKVKFKGGIPNREMVSKDSSDYTQILSVAPFAFLSKAAKSAIDIIEKEVGARYNLDRYLPEEKKEINAMLNGLLEKLTIPDIFALFVTGLTLPIPSDIKKKYGFKKDLKISSQPATEEYQKYQQFLNKLINLKYI